MKKNAVIFKSNRLPLFQKRVLEIDSVLFVDSGRERILPALLFCSLQRSCQLIRT